MLKSVHAHYYTKLLNPNTWINYKSREKGVMLHCKFNQVPESRRRWEFNLIKMFPLSFNMKYSGIDTIIAFIA